jgi:hypothetical protein
MAEYRVYVISGDGRIMKRIDLERADDNGARDAAKQYIGRHDIELWQRDRIIAKFDRKSA